jgi:VanZ family protein
LTAPARRAAQALLAVLLVAVAWLAFTPAPPPQADTGWDKANHALAFAVLALVAECGWWPHPQRSRRVALGLLAYGALIELVQSRIPERSGEWADWLADAIGIALALALVRLAQAPWWRRLTR